jgi:ribosomal-protein-alanine N-acetyltransferase
MAKIVIREMTVQDVPQVAEVENACFTNPWTIDIYYQELNENRYAKYFVVEWEEKIIGYAGVWLVIDEAQITNIAIHPDFRGKKLGEKLFQHVLLTVIQLGAKQLSLEVRQSNLVAQKMYYKFGLVPGGIRKNYYTDNQEDAIVMWVKFNEQG